MTRMIISTFAAFGLTLAATGSAFASSEQQDFDLCLNELQSAAADSNASFDLKSMSGGRLRHLTFKMTTDDKKETVVCNVRRGAVVNIDWIVS